MKYLIVGGGMTARAAVKGIREHDTDGEIRIVGAEPHPPYKRPPLSKKLWAGGDEEKIWRGTAERGAELKLGPPDRRARSRRPAGDRRRSGESTPTSGSCSRPAARRGGSAAATARSSTSARSTTTAGCASCRGRRAHVGRDRRRLHRLRARRRAGRERRAGDDACSRRPRSLAPLPRRPRRVRDRLLPRARASRCCRRDRRASRRRRLTVTTGAGRTLEGDAVVAGLGIDAGDRARRRRRARGRQRHRRRRPRARRRPRRRVRRRRRRELPGRALGQRRARRARGPREHATAAPSARTWPVPDEPYDHLPFFYSDLFELGYEAVGEVDSRLDDRRGLGRSRTGRASIAYVDDERPAARLPALGHVGQGRRRDAS